jgi:hypothetical protein
MLLESGLPKFLWAKAAHHTMWLRNQTMTNCLQLTTPYQVLRNKAPDLSHVVPWGMNIWVKVNGVGKLDARGRLGRFVGYNDESKAIRIYWPDSRSIGIEHDVLFGKDSPNLTDEIVEIVIDSSPPQVQQMLEVTCVTTPAPTTTIPSQPAPTSPPKADPKDDTPAQPTQRSTRAASKPPGYYK